MIRLRLLGTLELRDDEHELRAVLAQPKRLALLAYLAIATPVGFQRRDTLLALFWRDLDEMHARDALNAALGFLRRSLGTGAITSRGSEDVANEVVNAMKGALLRGKKVTVRRDRDSR